MNKPILQSFGRLAEWLEKGAMVALLLFLMIFAMLQIILRDLFGTGIPWADTVIRHAVIWTGLIGAMRATAEDRHIGIDLAVRLLPPEKRPVLQMASGIVCLLTCCLLFYASLIFVSYERLSLSVAFPGVPTWWLQVIFPVCFGGMALRYGLNLVRNLLEWHKGGPA